MTKITAPGIYDISADEYHADPLKDSPGGPSLSSTGARKLLNKCPARFRYEQDNPEPPKRHYDFGHAAHRLVLGRGDGIEVIAANDFRTKAAKEARDEAHAAGRVPMLKAEFDKAQEMAAAVFAHPFAGRLFEGGKPERSLFWKDAEFGVWRRSRPDFMPQSGTIFADYKTCASAQPDDLKKSIWNYGYHQQAAWYLDSIRALGIHDDPSLLFVFQEKEPPYLVTVAEADPVALGWGRIQNRKALSIFAECVETGVWPGYVDDVLRLPLPGFAEGQLEHAHDLGAFDPEPPQTLESQGEAA